MIPMADSDRQTDNQEGQNLRKKGRKEKGTKMNLLYYRF